LHKLFFPVVFYLVLPEILCQKTTEHGKKQHQELPEIMRPFFPAPVATGVAMGMVMNFHKNDALVGIALKIRIKLFR